LQHCEIEPLLVAEVVIDHPLVGAGAPCDGVDPGALEALGRELLGGGREDGCTRARWVAPPGGTPQGGRSGHASFHPRSSMHRLLKTFGTKRVVGPMKKKPRI